MYTHSQAFLFCGFRRLGSAGSISPDWVQLRSFATLYLHDWKFCISKVQTKPRLAYEQVPCEGRKKIGQRSVNPAAKRVGVGAWIRERSEWDAWEPECFVPFLRSFVPNMYNPIYPPLSTGHRNGWCNSNPSKCFVIRITRKREPVIYDYKLISRTKAICTICEELLAANTWNCHKFAWWSEEKSQKKSRLLKVPMKWNIFCAYLKGLSKYRRMTFFFLKYLFSF